MQLHHWPLVLFLSAGCRWRDEPDSLFPQFVASAFDPSDGSVRPEHARAHPRLESEVRAAAARRAARPSAQPSPRRAWRRRPTGHCRACLRRKAWLHR